MVTAPLYVRTSLRKALVSLHPHQHLLFFLVLLFVKFAIHLFICTRGHMCHGMPADVTEQLVRVNSVLYHVGPRGGTWVLRLGSRQLYLYPLTHCFGPVFF